MQIEGEDELPGAWEALLASDRVSRRTRDILEARRLPPETGSSVLTFRQRETLAAIVARVLPGCGSATALAAGLDATLSDGKGDGWRHAALPPDRMAWRAGLDTVRALASGFATLGPDIQDRWLRGMADGTVGQADHPERLSPAQMRLWFEDVRAAIVALWLAHPAAMARIGYDGFATGGDGLFQGFARTKADDAEDWEPPPARPVGEPRS